MSEEKIALMMVTYNRLDLTKKTLESIFDNTKIPFTLIIIDNNSQDGTKEFLAELKRENVVIHYNNENKGIAIGRNQALEIAVSMKAKWLCTIDNDVLVPEGWLEECIKVLRANPRYGAIGVNMEPNPYPIVNNNGCEFQRKQKGNLGTACMVFADTLQKMLGYFNTEYKLYAHEDADYGMRIRTVGLQLGYIKTMGTHIGEGANDTGEYRDFKNQQHKENLQKFHENCRGYIARRKPIYIPYKNE